MNNSLKSVLLLTIFVGIFFLSGCSGSQKASQQEHPGQTISARESKVSEHQHDLALQHFIEGAALDAKNSYAEAILEYQEALLSDPNASIYYAISRDYLLIGKVDRAIENASKAVQLETQNIPYLENLGTIYFSGSQIDSAIHVYEKIVAVDSNNNDGWFALARLYQPSRPQKTLEIYEKMLSRNGDQLDVLFQCAQIYSSLGRFDESAAKYKQMLELDPSNRALQKQLAETLAKGGRFDQARTLLQTMLEADSSDAEVVAALADIYLSQKEFQKAIGLYENLLNRGIKNPEVKIRIAIGFFGLTEHDSTLIPQSKNLFENLLAEIPRDWRPYWYLGAIASNQHQDSLAGDYFEQVTRLEEHNGDAWWYYGTSMFEQGKYNKVVEATEKAQKLLQNDFRFYLLEGLALTRMEKQEDALQPLRKAYELNPKDLNTLSTLALTLDGLHRYQESDPIYEEGLKQNPNSALLLNNYGYSLSERGLQLHRALEMAKQAVAAEPENAAYLDTYGWVYFKLDQYENAALYIEKAVATSRASADVHEHLGDVYQKLGRKDKAIDLWKKALEMNPKNEALKEKIAHGAN